MNWKKIVQMSRVKVKTDRRTIELLRWVNLHLSLTLLTLVLIHFIYAHFILSANFF